MIEVEFYNGTSGYSIERYGDHVTLSEVLADLRCYIDDRYAYVTKDGETYLVTKCNIERVYR